MSHGGDSGSHSNSGDDDSESTRTSSSSSSGGTSIGEDVESIAGKDAHDVDGDDVPTATTDRDGKSKGEARRSWDENYVLLKQYHAKHGNCEVPFSKTDRTHKLLARWIYTQQQRRNGPYGTHSALSSEQIERLEALDAFRVPARKRHSGWEARFEKLVAFKKEHGHSVIPWKNPYKKLASWLVRQKNVRDKRVGTSRQLTQVQVDKLTSIGAIEERTEEEVRQLQEQAAKIRSWEDQYRELKAFKEEYGHCKVPPNELKWKSLTEWLRNQKDLHDGKRLSLHQLRKLASLEVIHFEDGMADNNTPVSNDGKASAVDSSEKTKQSTSFILEYNDDGDRTINDSESPKKKARTDAGGRAGSVELDWFPCRVHVVLMNCTTTQIGFIMMPSRTSSTLADARKRIVETLTLNQYLDEPNQFEFHLPLGPISEQQEATVGPMWPFLKHYDPGRGFTKEGDAQVFIMKRAKLTD